eukprot:6624866-Pyramimonas_sp.AAC.1
MPRFSANTSSNPGPSSSTEKTASESASCQTSGSAPGGATPRRASVAMSCASASSLRSAACSGSAPALTL